MNLNGLSQKKRNYYLYRDGKAVTPDTSFPKRVGFEPNQAIIGWVFSLIEGQPMAAKTLFSAIETLRQEGLDR